MKWAIPLAAIASYAHAADYGIDWWNNPDNNTAMIIKGNENTGFAYMEAVKDNTLSFSVASSPADSFQFGVYTFDSNGDVLTSQAYDGLATGSTFSTNIKEGSLVAIWMTSGDYKIDSLDPNASFYNPQLNDNLLNYQFHTDGYGWSPWFNMSVVMKSESTMPSGQPLPGIAATLALSATIGSIAVYRNKRKNSKSL